VIKTCAYLLKISEKTTDFKGITAKKGTLKRKKQLREFVEHYNDGYDDDLYDSTPYRKQGIFVLIFRIGINWKLF
jgi:hypothetical protein